MSIQKFQELLVLQKIMGETERELGVKDKVLAEFILNLAKQSQGVDQFHAKLEENDAADEFGIDLINSIFSIVSKLLPKDFGGMILKKSIKQKQAEESKKQEVEKFQSSGLHDNLDDPTERFPKFKKQEKEEVSDEEAKEKEKNKLAEKFPGLAIANKVNEEEIELDLDFDNMFTKGDDQDDKKG